MPRPPLRGWPMSGGSIQVSQLNGAVQLMPAAVDAHGVLEGLPCAVLVLATDGCITFANRQAARLFGTEHDRLLGLTFASFVEANRRPHVQRAVARALAGHRAPPLECDIGLHTESHWAEVEFTPHEDGCLVLARRLRARRTRRPSSAMRQEAREANLVGLLDSIPIGVLISDGRGAPRLVNRVARDLLGIHALTPLDQWCASAFLLRPDGSPVTAEDIPFARTLRDGRPRRDIELQLVRPWGDPVPVRLSADAVLDREGRVVEVCCTLTNVRERAHIERQLCQAQKMEAIGLLAGGIAHDFGNILCAITGYAELGMVQTTQGGKVHALLSEIKKAGGRGADLTRQLLSFSRLGAVTPHVLDLDATVRDMEEMLHRLIGERIECTLDLDGTYTPIKAAPGQLEQIVLNLVVNAADAMPDGGRLRIHSRCISFPEMEDVHRVALPPGRYALLSVSDTGGGMDPATLARIFEPLFTTKGDRNGTGLGLSTVHGIVKDCHGCIDVESEPGLGTTFRIYLPCVEAEVTPTRPLPSPPTSLAHRGKTVLVVEDEPMVRALLRAILEGAHYQVLEASNGREALELVAREVRPVPLLITDVVMPKMGGIELAIQLRRRCRDLRVLFLSGYADESLTASAVMEPGTSFLPKPFDAQTLTGQVRRLLDQQRA